MLPKWFPTLKLSFGCQINTELSQQRLCLEFPCDTVATGFSQVVNVFVVKVAVAYELNLPARLENYREAKTGVGGTNQMLKNSRRLRHRGKNTSGQQGVPSRAKLNCQRAVAAGLHPPTSARDATKKHHHN